jgi:hypothetical protein
LVGKRRKSGARSADGASSSTHEPHASSAAHQPRTRNKSSQLRNPRWPWLLAGGLAFLATAVTFDPRLYINGDNVSYMFLARDVLAGELWPSSKFPPLFPWLLAPVQWIVGVLRSGATAAPPSESLIAQKLLVLGFYAGAIVFVIRILRRRVPLPAGPVVAFVAVTLLPVVEYAHYVMSEIPYLFFLAGSLDAADRVLASAPRDRAGDPKSIGVALRTRTVWELALWVAAGFYTRSAGVSAGIGIGIALLARRRFGPALAYAAAFTLLALPWMVIGLTREAGNPYIDQFLLVNPYYPEFGRIDARGLLERIWFNLRAYGELHIPASLVPFPYRSTYSSAVWQKTPPPLWLTIPILLAILAGSIRTLRRFDPAAWGVIVSILLVLIWPPVWAANRFLIPLAPILFWILWEGLRIDIGRTAIWSRGRAVVSAAFVAHGLLVLRNYEAETREYDPVWKNYFATIDWIAENTPPDAHVIDRKPGFVEFSSGRSSETFPREPDLDRMIDFFRTSEADYVLLNRLPYDDIGRYLVPVVNQRREHFEVVFQINDPEPDPRFNGDAFVLKFLP